VLAPNEIARAFEAAVEGWTAIGQTAARIASMRGVTFEMADLPGVQLARVAGTRIIIDRDAAGHGWCVEPTQNYRAGSESLGRAGSQAPAGMDLVTAIMHELGHFIGLPDVHDEANRDDIMFARLAPGERRAPRGGVRQ
jgi:hypothetical protein